MRGDELLSLPFLPGAAPAAHLERGCPSPSVLGPLVAAGGGLGWPRPGSLWCCAIPSLLPTLPLQFTLIYTFLDMYGVPLRYGSYVYPAWGTSLGVCMGVLTCLQIPLWATVALCRESGTLSDVSVRGEQGHGDGDRDGVTEGMGTGRERAATDWRRCSSIPKREKGLKPRGLDERWGLSPSVAAPAAVPFPQ